MRKFVFKTAVVVITMFAGLHEAEQQGGMPWSVAQTAYLVGQQVTTEVAAIAAALPDAIDDAGDAEGREPSAPSHTV